MILQNTKFLEMLSSRSAILRRAFSNKQETSLSLLEGKFLNRFADTGSEDDFAGQSVDEDDFDVSEGKSPIVAQIQRSKPVILGGECSSSSRPSVLQKARGFKSRRAEEVYKRAHMVFDGDVRVRVMDVDQFRLDELHHYFMFTLVRRFSAEKCVKVASRVALFRDKHTQHSFESMSKDVADIFGPVHGAELTALFSRCYNTIPIAFMLDYTRRFGKFSRRFIALEVEKTLKPRLFDFVRYSSGVRPLPGIVTRPFSLRSFAWMLPPCSAKRYIFQHLLAHSGDEKIAEILKIENSSLKALTDGKKMDSRASKEARVSEKMSSGWQKVKRPDQLEAIERNILARQPSSADDIIAQLEKEDFSGESRDEGAFGLQTMQVEPFKSPLMEDCDQLSVVGNENEVERVDWTEFEREHDQSWWKDRRTSTSFFRHDKKAYRLDHEQGWKQIEDPRGQLPDYDKMNNIRRRKRELAKLPARRIRRHARNSLIDSISRNKTSK